MRREDAEIRALMILSGRERATLEDLVTAIQEAWAEGYGEGERDGYGQGVNAEIDLRSE